MYVEFLFALFPLFLCCRLMMVRFRAKPSGQECGRDSSVGKATRYGLDGPGIECRWWREFPQPSRTALGPTQPPIQWVPGLYQRVKRPGRGLDHRPPSSAEVKERVEIYLSPPLGFRGLFQGEICLLF